MGKIPIIMATDDNYIFQTAVAMSSLLQSKRMGTNYKIYILDDGKLSAEGKKIVNDTYHRYCSDNIEYVSIPTEMFTGMEGKGHISAVTYYRFIVADVLWDIEKCIYLDVDTLILGDLTEAYNVDLNNYYLAAVLDCGVQYNKEKYSQYFTERGIPDDKEYFNAGFLVMNLLEIRKSNLKERLFAEAKKEYKFNDQDILNICCRGKVWYLPLKYNFFAAYYQNGNFLKGTCYSEEEICEAEMHPIMLHYASSHKPWLNVAYDKEGFWWKQAGCLCECKQYQELRARAVAEPVHLRWINMVEKCLAKKNVMVFGYSDIGKSVVDMLQINGVGQIRVICDNNKEKQGGNYRNIPVKGIEGALGDLGSSYHIVITSQNYANEISRQLQLCGIRREDMSVYMNKNFPYYYKLDKKYLKVEIEEIFLKKYGTLDKYRKEIDKCLRMVRGDRQALLKFL